MTPYKRGGTASMIVSAVCNEEKNSDLRANSLPIMKAFNEHFEELQEQGEEVKRAARSLAEYALAARIGNSAEYMDGLARRINKVANAIGDAERAQFDQASGGFKLCAGLRVKHHNDTGVPFPLSVSKVRQSGEAANE